LPTWRLRAAGRVQGVGYRWFVRETARALGLSGWVRNEPDGDVLVVAAGTVDELQSLAAAMRDGPPGALVAHLDAGPLTALEAGQAGEGQDAPHAMSFPFRVVR
jgi:acylphosphatase